MKLKNLIALILCLLICQVEIFAAQPQSDPRTVAERLYYFDIAGSLKETDTARINESRDAMADLLGKNGYAFLYYALPAGTVKDSFMDFLLSIEKNRVDGPIGPDGGSTSTISKTGSTTMMGFGLDTGDAVHTFQQNVATLRLNLDGFSRFLSNQEVIPTCAPSDPGCTTSGWLKNVDYGVSFNVTNSSSRKISATTPPTLVFIPAEPNPDPNADPDADPTVDPTIDPNATQSSIIESTSVDFTAAVLQRHFSSTTVRYSFLNKRDLRSVKYREKWLRSFQVNNPTMQEAGRDLWNYMKLILQQMQVTGQNGKLVRDTGEKDQYSLWLADTREKLRNAPRTESAWQRVLQEQLDLLLQEMLRMDRDFDSRSRDLAKAYVHYIGARTDYASLVDSSPGLTGEYTYSKPSFQPGIHTIKVAYSFSPGNHDRGGRTGTITINAGVDLYHGAQMTETESETSRFRGGQLALQFDRPLGPGNSPAMLSVGGAYLFSRHPVVNIPPSATITGTSASAGDQLLLPRSPIFVGDATFTLRVARNGVKIPIGISWSSRTDLSKGSEFRGHIGLSFDSLPLLLLPGLN